MRNRSLREVVLFGYGMWILLVTISVGLHNGWNAALHVLILFGVTWILISLLSWGKD